MADMSFFEAFDDYAAVPVDSLHIDESEIGIDVDNPAVGPEEVTRPEGIAGDGALMNGTVPRGRTPAAVKPITKTTQRLRGYEGANPLPKGVRRNAYEKVCAVAELLYRSNDGQYPELELLRKHTGLSDRTLSRTLNSREFINRMARHGIKWPKSNGKDKAAVGLSPDQILAINYICDPTSKLDLKAKLKRAGVPYMVYRNWLSDPKFRDAVVNFAEDSLEAHMPDFHTKLVEKGLSGDLRTIQFIYELTGRHDPNKQQMIDFQKMVMLLLEIITRNVRDPVVLGKINNEMDVFLRGEVVGTPKAIDRSVPDNYTGPLAGVNDPAELDFIMAKNRVEDFKLD